MSRVVRVAPGSGQDRKVPSTVAECVFHAMNDESVPDAGFKFMKLTPIKKLVDGEEKTALCRFRVEAIRASCACFTPKELTDAEISEEFLKRATAGAAWASDFSKLPKTHTTGVLWEVELNKNPPGAFRPVKPKM